MSLDNVAPFGRHTTVVKTSVHSPTDSSLLGDGVRLLVRSMKKIAKLAGDAGIRLRDRSQSVKLWCSILRGRHAPSLRLWSFPRQAPNRAWVKSAASMRITRNSRSSAVW